MLHYLNTSYTEYDISVFHMDGLIPSDIAMQVFLRELGVKFDAVLPTSNSKPLGYASSTYNPVTRTVKIRQVIR